MWASHSGKEARWHIGQESYTGADGPYAQNFSFDQWGNITQRNGWGVANASYTASYSNNRRTGFSYDYSGNLTNDGSQTFTYDATGQQATASGSSITQTYDGDGLRAKKTENGTTTYYLRSSVLGGQVISELNSSGGWNRGYVYLGGQLVAIQYGGVSWVHQDPVTKSQRVTNSSGTVTSTIDLDPWGGETGRSSNQAFQPHRYTSYERDANGGDDAMFRRYQSAQSRFHQPDPYDGSYNLTDPQSLNRYAYTQNDPVNFVDPSGLDMSMCSAEFSYEQCGGDSGFWSGSRGGGSGGGGGGGFGDDVARYNRDFAGVPAHARGAYADYLGRLQNTYDALAATAAYRRGGPNDPTYREIMSRNPTLQAIVVFSPAQQRALALISLIFGQAVGDQIRFDAVAQLTGLGNYINGYTYNAADRTFSVNFDAGVDKFLASSPYFAGPGLALLHRDVGMFDYRSYADLTGGLSMQVVLGRDPSRSYADFDRDNPYQDLGSFVRHNVPIIVRRIGRIGR